MLTRVVLMPLNLNAMNKYFVYKFLFLGVVFLMYSCNKNIIPVNDQTPFTFNHALKLIDETIKENAWINSGDTIYIKPYLHINEKTCTYGRLNFDASFPETANHRYNKSLFGEIADNLDTSNVINNIDCIDCDKQYVLSNKATAYNFSPLFKVSETEYFLFTYQYILNHERGFNFMFNKEKGKMVLKHFYYVSDCTLYQTDINHIRKLKKNNAE